jgi:hypothetical protein
VSAAAAKPRVAAAKPRVAATRAATATASTAKSTGRGRRPGSPLAGTGTGSRRFHRNATGQRLGPGSISGGV